MVYYEEMKGKVKEMHNKFSQNWGVTISDQKRYINEYRKIFKIETDGIEIFKQKMIKIIM